MARIAESRLSWLASLAGAALLCAAAPGIAQPPSAAKSRLQPRLVAEQDSSAFRVRSEALAIQPITLDVSRFTFTAPGQVASSRVQTVERGFSFTPSGQAGRRGVSVGMTARTLVPAAADRATTIAAAAPTPGLMPAGYNFDLSVGYRGFAVSGGVSRVDTGVGGRSREGVDLGIGYAETNWRAGVIASAEREEIDLLPRAGGMPDPRYALEARGSVLLSPQISLGGSFRYRLAPQQPTPLDPNRDDRAVLLGGSVAF